MAIQRQFNWLGAQRVDVPHLRLVESAVAGDFQQLSGTLLAGSKALVAHGAVILDTGVVGSPASSLLMRMASAVLLHATAAEPGTLFVASASQPDDVLNGTNPNVIGSFTPGVHQVNYVALDLLRVSDPTTNDSVAFRSASTGIEFNQTVPLGRVLQYRIHITTSDFGSNPSYCPIAIVTVDANGNIESIKDSRQMFWRLGTGGNSPSAIAQYVWANRNEDTSSSGFTGGDKNIQSQSEFNRAITQRLWELGGGEHWYAPADDRTVQLTYDNTLIFPTTGENWDSISSPGNLLWRGLSFWFANSTATENVVADATVATPGLTDLADGQLIYVELNRTSNVTVTPIKAAWSVLFALPPATPGSRFVLAWRQHGRIYVGHEALVVNIGGAHASNTVFGTVKLFTLFVPDTANPVVPVMDAEPASVLANPATAANVVARGITRDSAGILYIGPNTNTFDTEIDISATSILTKILGSLQVLQGGTFTNSLTNGNGVSATGNGSGAGVHAAGGTSGIGIIGVGGSSNNTGVSGTGGATNGRGVFGQGTGSGDGVVGLGGTNNGDGVTGTGGTTNGNGLVGNGTGSGDGVVATGGASNGNGVSGTGGATNGNGVVGVGAGTGAGVTGTGGTTGHGVVGVGVGGSSRGGDFTGGSPNGNGTVSLGVGAGTGAVATGGNSDGTGVTGQGGFTNGIGVVGSGRGSGTGVEGSGDSGSGLTGLSVTGYGASLFGNTTKAPVHLEPLAGAPSTPAEGDIYYDVSVHHFYGWTGAAWKQLDN